MDWKNNRDQTRSFLFVINFLNINNLLFPLSGFVAMTDSLSFF